MSECASYSCSEDDVRFKTSNVYLSQTRLERAGQLAKLFDMGLKWRWIIVGMNA